MPDMNYKKISPEDFFARLVGQGITVKNINKLESLAYGVFVFGDDSDTRAEIFLDGKKVALVRNSYDGQDAVVILDRGAEAKIRQLLLQYEVNNNYAKTCVVCNYEMIEVQAAA
jgi:hypothetical protein